MSKGRSVQHGGGSLEDSIRAVAYHWDSLDSSIRSFEEGPGNSLRFVKLIFRGDEWLVLLSAEVNGARVVSFRTASSSHDIGKVVRFLLDEGSWKVDKFAPLDKGQNVV